MPSEKKRPVKIAVTGPPAAGKSTILALLQDLGVPTFSADAVVKELSKPCREGYHLFCQRFGRGFLTASGELDRRLILEAMLADPQFKKTLEEIFHPLVKKELFRWFQREKGQEVLAAEIPLLYQAGWADFFDQVIWVDCPEELLLARLEKRLGRKDLARKLLEQYQAGLPPKRKALELAGYLPRERLAEKITAILNQLKRQK